MRNSNRAFLFMLCACLSFGFAGCKKDGEGDIISTDVTVTGFHTLSIDGPFIVYLIQDNAGFVEFTGEKKHVNTCTALVSDSILSIDGSRHGEFLHPGEAITQAFVHIDTTLRRINANADCKLYTTGALLGKEIGLVLNTRSLEGKIELNCRTFYYWNNPNGTHLEITGVTQELKIWNTGLGSIDASNCTANYVEVIHGGQNECKVRATQELVYGLTGVGNIIYYGNPALIRENSSTGTGELIKGD